VPERDWWLAVRDGSGAVVGAGMRTAPFPMLLLPMPDDAALAAARALHERGEELLGLNGTLPAARVCADELARLGEGRVEVSLHTRLHELTQLVPPAPVPGRLVAAAEDDVDLVEEWCAAFHGDADEQAGRPTQRRGVRGRPRGEAAPAESNAADGRQRTALASVGTRQEGTSQCSAVSRKLLCASR
jgi:hypothetical protein